MEPVTHVLTGACLARAGFNRHAAYATLTMAVAAEMPDIDTVWSWRGPVEGFAHHRGITHTLLGLPIEAAILVGAVWGLHRWRAGCDAKARIESGPSSTSKALTKAPVRWRILYGCALVGLLSHLLLDYTNNYGLRPFYPFDPHWYAASIAFIFDPVIFTLLLFALVMPSLFGLVSSEVGAKEQPFRGRGLAIGALLGIAAWLGLRTVEHANALQLAWQQTYELQQMPVDVPVTRRVGSAAATRDAAEATATAASVYAPETELVQPPSQLLQAQKILASPEPLNPFHWAVAIDYGPLYQLANVDVRSGAVTPSEVTYPKLPVNAVLRAAEGSPLGRAYLDWSSMPIFTEEQPVAGPLERETRRVVLRDPRFLGDVSWLKLAGTTPLTGVVTVDDSGKIVRQTMDGRREPAGHGPVYEAHWTLPWLQRGPEEKAAAMPVPKPVLASKPRISELPVAQAPTTVTPPPVVAEQPKPAPPPTPAAARTATAPPVTTPVAAKPAPPPAVAKVEAPKAEPPKVQPAMVDPLKPEPAKPVVPKAATTKVETPHSAGEPAPAKESRSLVTRFENWIHWLANGK